MTTRVDFYLLKESEMTAKHTYACRIANKAFAQGLKVYVHTNSPDESQTLDKLLWTFSQHSFVPHAVQNNEKQDANRYPVQIGDGAPPDNFSDLLISLKPEAPADYAQFARVAELIMDEAGDKSAGRTRYRFYRAQGIEPQTHKIA